MIKNSKKNRRFKKSNNRLYLVVAVIFLLYLALLTKLYKVQILNHDYYTALASSQHEMQATLQPERGSIFISDSNGKEVFPVAANKNFASVFFVPKEAINLDVLAEKVYLALNHKEVLSLVEEKFAKEQEEELQQEINYINSLDLSEEERKSRLENAKYRLSHPNQEKAELLEIEKNLEIEKAKEEILENYLKKLRKRNDPYEPVKDKVSEEEILILFRYLAATSDEPLPEETLRVNNFKIYLQSDQYNLDENIELKEDGQIIYPGISYQLKTFRYYPEKEIVAHLVGFASSQDDLPEGRYGLEEFFNAELSGQSGYLQANRGSGRVINVNDRKYSKAVNGADIFLTIDLSVQFMICDKLKQGIEKYDAESGTVIVVEPKTGAILAMCSLPSFDPNSYAEVEDLKVFNNPATFYQYEPGSIFKTITMAIALDQNKIEPHTYYEDKGQIMIKGWPKPIKNSDFFTHGPHGQVDMNTVLAESLNTGAIFAMQKVGKDKFSEYVEKFGFGQKSGIELGSEATGNINNLLENNIKEVDAATASFGQGIAVTPLQMIMSYAAIANGGTLMKPYLVKEIKFSDGNSEVVQPRIIRQVISQKSASLTSAMLVNVLESGHAIKAKVPGYYIGGKTGTAQVANSGGYSENNFIHSFVGIAPIDNPAFVVLVKLDHPQAVKFSADSAAPVFSDIADFLLKYYQIPQDR
ncbi:MAG: penicillin-binding protein 2 [Candidatus Pacebacteria bacterium]|nr:penicillin-binding protein 2 [Candidatus Paceibacterota bacterium]